MQPPLWSLARHSHVDADIMEGRRLAVQLGRRARSHVDDEVECGITFNEEAMPSSQRESREEGTWRLRRRDGASLGAGDVGWLVTRGLCVVGAARKCITPLSRQHG